MLNKSMEMEESNRYCNRCANKVEIETVEGLKEEYPYVCPFCDENLYEFETHKKEE